jgi:hypothetical protein
MPADGGICPTLDRACYLSELVDRGEEKAQQLKAKVAGFFDRNSRLAVPSMNWSPTVFSLALTIPSG